MQAAVYQIVNTVTGMKYIGSTSDISTRFATHLRRLNATGKQRKHHNNHLQAAWNKYGETAFRFDVIQHCDSGEEALKIENELFDVYKAWKMWDELYNKAQSAHAPSLGAKWNLGKPCSKETKCKISESLKGNVPWNKGKTISEEVKKKISDSKIGIKQSNERKKKTSEAMKDWWAKRKADETNHEEQS